MTVFLADKSGTWKKNQVKGLEGELTQSARLGCGGDCLGGWLRFHSTVLSFSGFEVRQLYVGDMGNTEKMGQTW